MKQNINITNSQAGSNLEDGDERNFCFLSIDVVNHSDLSSNFSQANINNTLMNLRKWLNSVISKKEGKEHSWAGDGGIFSFLQEKTTDKAVDNAVLASMDILDGLAGFNNSHNQLYMRERRTDIRLRFGMDFGRTICRAAPGNWHGEALNTAAKIQGMAQHNSVLITHNVYKDLTDSLRVHLRETSVKFKGRQLYTFSYERIIDPAYEDYFMTIAKLRQEEFEHLGHWVDLYAIETKLASLQEQDKGRVFRAIDLINECVKSSKNALIFGESGSGKTFTCLKLFERFKEEYSRPDAALNERIPLFVELSRIRNNDLDTVIRESMDEAQFNRDKDKYIVFLDGLNETGDIEEQKEVLSEIKRFSVLYSKTRLFVTTQTIAEHHQKSGFELYGIQPFRKEDVIEYLCKFKDKFESLEEAELFYDNLPGLIKEFISIPVFLYFMVSTYERGRPVEISTPGELIGQYENFLCGARKSRPLDMDEDYRTRLIPFIAFNMCQNNETDIPLRHFNEYIHQYNKDNRSSINEKKIRDILTNRFKLMKKNEKGEFRFVLQTLRDYFAAVYMKGDVKGNALGPEEILGHVYTDSTRNNDLVNAVRLLAGIVKPEIAKGIIHEFIEKDLYLACDMFAWSSVATYEEKFIDLMDEKIDINSREYLLKLNEAIAFYLKVLDLLQRTKRLDEPISAGYMQLLGLAYRKKLDLDSAIEGYQKAIEIYEKNDMQNHPDYAMCHMNLGAAYRNKSDLDSAIEGYQKAIEIYEKNDMQNHPDYAMCHMNLGIAYWSKSDYDSAIEVFKKAIEIYEKNDMQNHPDYAMCHMNLGIAYGVKSDYDSAIEVYQKAIKIYEENNMQNHPSYALCHMNLGLAYHYTGRKDEAIKSLELALSILEQSVGKEHPYYQKCLENLKEIR